MSGQFSNWWSDEGKYADGPRTDRGDAIVAWNAAVDAVVEALKSREKAFRSKFLADGVVNDILRMKAE